MKHVKKILLLVCCLAVGIADVLAQQGICTTGGDTHGNGTISYTVGQPFYVVSSSNSGSLTPGVQQTYVITTIETAIAEISPMIKMNVYPNPTVDHLTLRIDNESGKNLRYTLTDNNGRHLEKSNVETSLTDIDMSCYAPSVYFINVFNGDMRLQSFKIVKIK